MSPAIYIGMVTGVVLLVTTVVGLAFSIYRMGKNAQRIDQTFHSGLTSNDIKNYLDSNLAQTNALTVAVEAQLQASGEQKTLHQESIGQLKEIDRHLIAIESHLSKVNGHLADSIIVARQSSDWILTLEVKSGMSTTRADRAEDREERKGT